jgi:hypothetical protein
MATTGVTLASGNRVSHKKVRETAFGVTPTSPAMKALRVTSSSLQPNIDTVVSSELRTDRQIPDQTTVAVKAAGDLSVELSFNALDDFIEEVLQGAWVTKPVITNTGAGTPISALSTTTATVASGGAVFLAGMIVQTSGFALAANNKTAVVASSTGTTVVFPASTFTADASPQAGATLRVVGFQGASGDITATASGLGSTTLDFTTLGISVGDWINVGGLLTANQFATAANNTYIRVTNVAAHALTCDNLPTGWTTDAGTGKTISVFYGDSLINGTTVWTSTIERAYADQATPTFEYYTGSVTNGLNLSLSAGQIITGSVAMISQNAAYQTSRVSGATDIAAPTYPVLNATSNFGRIGVGGASLAGPNYIMAATVDISNNVTADFALGTLGAVGMTNGDFNVTGTLNVYFGDTTLLANLLNNAATSLNFILNDGNSPREAYVIDFPQVKYTSGQINNVAKNQAVMQSIGFRAVLSPTYGYTSKVCRFWYTE